MKVLIDVSVVPLGVGTSLSSYVAACERVFAEAGLKTTLHAFGTNVEGEWDAVFAAVKRCHEVVHGLGARVSAHGPTVSRRSRTRCARARETHGAHGENAAGRRAP